MSKQNLFTAAGVALSFIIAIGGWFLTNTLIDMKSDALLSATGITFVNAPDTTTSDASDDEVSDYQTEREIVSILQNWESDGDEKPHEPMKGQIDMERAISVGRSALLSFSEQGLIPSELLDMNSTSAYLAQNLLAGTDSLLNEPMYSYWTVSFSGQYINATIIINAVTGQVWKSNIVLTPTHAGTEINELSKDDINNALTAFISGIGIESDGEIITNKTTAYMGFAANNAYAIFSVAGRTYEDMFYLSELNIYLSTQEP